MQYNFERLKSQCIFCLKGIDKTQNAFVKNRNLLFTQIACKKLVKRCKNYNFNPLCHIFFFSLQRKKISQNDTQKLKNVLIIYFFENVIIESTYRSVCRTAAYASECVFTNIAANICRAAASLLSTLGNHL